MKAPTAKGLEQCVPESTAKRRSELLGRPKLQEEAQKAPHYRGIQHLISLVWLEEM